MEYGLHLSLSGVLHKKEVMGKKCIPLRDPDRVVASSWQNGHNHLQGSVEEGL